MLSCRISRSAGLSKMARCRPIVEESVSTPVARVVRPDTRDKKTNPFRGRSADRLPGWWVDRLGSPAHSTKTAGIIAGRSSFEGRPLWLLPRITAPGDRRMRVTWGNYGSHTAPQANGVCSLIRGRQPLPFTWGYLDVTKDAS